MLKPYFNTITPHYISFYTTAAVTRLGLLFNSRNLILNEHSWRMFNWIFTWMLFRQNLSLFTQFMDLRQRIIFCSQFGEFDDTYKQIIKGFESFYQDNASFSIMSNVRQYINPRKYAKEHGVISTKRKKFDLAIVLSSFYAEKAPLRFFRRMSGVVQSLLPVSSGFHKVLSDYLLPAYSISREAEQIMIDLFAGCVQKNLGGLHRYKYQFIFGEILRKRRTYLKKQRLKSRNIVLTPKQLKLKARLGIRTV